tara:strand:- start:316 stop:465 length:150 start_codon:yes stop_codon:yes gene_type:complete
LVFDRNDDVFTPPPADSRRLDDLQAEFEESKPDLVLLSGMVEALATAAC